jgi:hypothetical protein
MSAFDKHGALTTVRRRAPVIALALLVMLLLAARPVCEAAGASGGALHAAMARVLGHTATGHAPQEGSDAPTCCASATGGTLVKASDQWLQAPASGKLAALLIVFVLTAAAALPRAAAIPSRSDPRSLPYHTRSARIQR